MMIQLKQLLLFRLLILAISYTMAQKHMKLKKDILDHDYGKDINTQEFNKLKAANFAARLDKKKLATKAHIVDLVKQDRF